MPRVRTYYYDPAKLEGRGANNDLNSGGDNSSSQKQKRTLLGRARQELENNKPAPATPMVALMEAAPGVDAEESALEREQRFEPLRTAMETVLDEREQFVIHALFWGDEHPLRAFDPFISKTHIARIRDRALGKLRDALSVETLGQLISTMVA